MPPYGQVLESGSLQQMADKVAALQQSLDVLGHVSDYEERRQTLEEHRNRLEATASPHLVAAITDADTCQSTQSVPNLLCFAGDKWHIT